MGKTTRIDQRNRLMMHLCAPRQVRICRKLHIWLYNRDEPRLLADRRILRQRLRLHLQRCLRREPLRRTGTSNRDTELGESSSGDA